MASSINPTFVYRVTLRPVQQPLRLLDFPERPIEVFDDEYWATTFRRVNGSRARVWLCAQRLGQSRMIYLLCWPNFIFKIVITRGWENKGAVARSGLGQDTIVLQSPIILFHASFFVFLNWSFLSYYCSLPWLKSDHFLILCRSDGLTGLLLSFSYFPFIFIYDCRFHMNAHFRLH